VTPLLASNNHSQLLDYLARNAFPPGTRLPPIQELAKELGISTGKLREQLEVARALGLLEVRPKTGIRTTEFSFLPAVRISLNFALAVNPANFDLFGILRNHVEAAFWEEAVSLLDEDDLDFLQELVASAWRKLEGDPIQIPHSEHRELHMALYRKLENPFVLGLLEAYWEAYEAVGLNLYADYSYLREVWTYHQEMVESIVAGDLKRGYQALVEHTGLLHNRPETSRMDGGQYEQQPATLSKQAARREG